MKVLRTQNVLYKNAKMCELCNIKKVLIRFYDALIFLENAHPG